MKKQLVLIPALLAAFTVAAEAHVGVGPTSGALNGFLHPITGLDHVCAMLAVGLWAAQRGGRALWLVPLTFVSVMMIGGALGMAGVGLPFVEKGIMVSVLMLGVFVAAAVRLPLLVSVLLVGLFALFHGHAHGVEMPESASGFAFGLGFVVATAFLHLAGIGLALSIQRLVNAHWIRATGGVIAAYGVYLLAA